jgi:drug/metabolite transporter (DMT)-like permease
VFTPLVARVVLRERFPALGYAGAVISLAGVIVIILDRGTAAQYTAGGLVLIFVAVFAAVGYTISLRFLAPRYRPLSIAKFQSLFALPAILILALSLEGIPEEIPANPVLLHLAYLGIFPSSLAFVFLNRGVRELGASRANAFVNLVPVFTALISWLYLGESFTALKIAGMAVVIGGVVVVQRARSSLTARPTLPTISS